MAVSYGQTVWDSAPPNSADPIAYRDITLSVGNNDLIIVAGFSENADGGTPAVATQSGSTGAWTLGRTNTAINSPGVTIGHAVASATGSVTIRVTVGISTNGQWMGVGYYVIPAGEWTGTPAYVSFGIDDADGQASATLSATSKVFYLGADWAAGAPGTTNTPAGGVNDTTFQDSIHYSIATRHWDSQASGTRAYGPSAPGGNRWVGALVVVEEVSGAGSRPATLTGTGTITASGSVTDVTVPIPTSVVASGTASTSGGTSPLSVAIPAGAAENDVLYAIFVVKPTTVGVAPTVTATNWTQEYMSDELGGGTLGVGTGPVRLVVMERIVPAGGLTGSVSFTFGSANSYAGRMLLCRYDATGYTSPSWYVLTATTYSRTTSSTTFGGTGAANLNLAANDVLAFASIASDDAASSHDSGANHTLTATGATLGTLTKVGTNVTTTGNDTSMYLAYAPVTAGPSSAAPVVGSLTSNSAETGGGVFLRIRAVGVPPSGDFTGAASRAGTGSTSAAGVVGKVVGAALAATVAITSAGAVGVARGASVAGTGTISASGFVTTGVTGSASLSGTGSTTAAGVVGRSSAASLPGTGSIAAAGIVARASGSTLAGTASVTASGSVGTGGWSIVAENAISTNVFDRTFYLEYGGTEDIPAFTRSTYYEPGDTLQISANYASAYTVEIWRLGWYGGTSNARKITTITGTPTTQPSPTLIPNSNGAVTCSAWSVTDSWTIPTDATPGWYWILLRGSNNTDFSGLPFVVSDAADKADIVVVSSEATWHAAYNGFGGNNVYGASLGIGTITARALCSTYDKPLITRQHVPQTFFANGELAQVRWMERMGFQVGYTTCEQVDADPTILDGRSLIIFSGHNEYISQRIRDKVVERLSAGVNVANFAGNDFFWRVAYGDSAGFTHGSHTGRVMWCKKDTMAGPGGHTAGTPFTSQADWTGTWQDTRWTSEAGTTELFGDRFIANGIRSDSVKVPFSYKTAPIWRDCPGVQALTTGQTLTFGAGTAGMEWDKIETTLPSVALSESSVDLTGNASDINGETYNNNGTYLHQFQIVRNGGIVFNANTTQWGWALDDTHDRGTAVASVDAQQATLNVLYDLGAVADSASITAASLTIPTPASMAAYGLPDPSSGATLAGTGSITASGTVVGASGATVAGTGTISATGTVGSSGSPQHTIFVGEPGVSPTVFTDGTPTITTADAFYRLTSATDGWRVVGGRIWIPVGQGLNGQTVTVMLYSTAYGPNVRPDLSTTPLRTATGTTVADGWTNVYFDTPYAPDVALNEVVWIATRFEGTPAAYVFATPTTSAAQQASDGSSVYRAENSVGGGANNRPIFRIGTGATTVGSNTYGHDIIWDEGAGSGLTGTSSLAGTGSITAAGVVDRSSGATLAGTGSVAAAGSVVAGSSATVAGAGSIAATGFLGVARGASLTGIGAIVAAGVVGLSGSASLPGTGSMSAGGRVDTAATASVAGTGSVVASGIVARAATAAVAGTGSVTAAGVVVAAGQGVATVSGTGSISANGVVARASGAAVAGTGSVVAVPVLGETATAAVAGAGSISASGVVARASGATVAGTGSITADGSSGLNLFRSASLPGTGSITATGVVGTVRSASLSGTGSVTAATSVLGKTATASPAAVGSITADGVMARASAAAVGGTGSIASDGVVARSSPASLVGVGAVDAAGDVTLHFVGTAAVPGVGVVAATGGTNIIIYTPTPPERVGRILWENRTGTIPFENRHGRIPAEDRTFTIPKGEQT